jgi:hypothetical protein
MGKRFECSATVVGAASGGAPTRKTAPAVAVRVEYPPLSVELARGASARWIDSGGLLGGSGSVWAKSARGRCYLWGKTHVLVAKVDSD